MWQSSAKTIKSKEPQFGQRMINHVWRFFNLISFLLLCNKRKRNSEQKLEWFIFCLQKKVLKIIIFNKNIFCLQCGKENMLGSERAGHYVGRVRLTFWIKVRAVGNLCWTKFVWQGCFWIVSPKRRKLQQRPHLIDENSSKAVPVQYFNVCWEPPVLHIQMGGKVASTVRMFCSGSFE